MPHKIMVVLGSTRDGRAGEKVADWTMKQLKECEGKCTFELVDLKELNLPFMAEPIPPMMGKPYIYEHSKTWSKMVSEADGFIFITPEYNHGYSAILKNAIDYLYAEWDGKPVGFVGYGSGGAKDAIRQLREILVQIKMQPLEYQVGISAIWEAFDDNGVLKEDALSGSLLELTKHLQAAL